MEAQGVDIDAIASSVCNSLDQPVGKMLDLIEKKHGIRLGREQPYEIVRRAAATGRLQYDAPIDSQLSHRLIEDHVWLRRTRVVRTSAAADVARHAARLLLDTVAKWDKAELHIGFAGGGLMAETVRIWAGFLRFSGNLGIKRLVVHALVAASHDPRSSPNGFVQRLLDVEDSLPFKIDFISLPTPAFLSPSASGALRELEGFRDVFSGGHKLDLVVTSAGAHWAEGHSALYRQLAEASPESVSDLKRAGCIGDLLWQPFGLSGPFEAELPMRAVTLLDLMELPDFVRRGGRVMLVLAPCGAPGCGKPKDEVFRSVLGWRDGVTDIIVDVRTAALATASL